MNEEIEQLIPEVYTGTAASVQYGLRHISYSQAARWHHSACTVDCLILAQIRGWEVDNLSHYCWVRQGNCWVCRSVTLDVGSASLFVWHFQR